MVDAGSSALLDLAARPDFFCRVRFAFRTADGT